MNFRPRVTSHVCIIIIITDNHNHDRHGKKTFVRSGVRTHALIRGPEFSPAIDGKVNLESGALDHSAILTAGCRRDDVVHTGKCLVAHKCRPGPPGVFAVPFLDCVGTRGGEFGGFEGA